MKNKLGFTLIEILVVVLIIGILAAIAIPQYKMAVTKAKVASILPIMRRWRDALMEYKLQHGSYCKDTSCDTVPYADDLGVNWPSDWKDFFTENSCDNTNACANDYWDECHGNEDPERGIVFCMHAIGDDSYFQINMYQPDDPDYENFRDKITCYAEGDEAHRICKALGGKLPEGGDSEYILY